MEFLPILPTVGRALVVISSWYELYRVIGMIGQGVYIIPSTPARGEHATRSAFISDPEKTDETIEIDESGFSNFLCSRYEAMTDRRASSVCADMYPLMFLAAPNQNTRPINLVEYASERHPRGTCLEESRRDGM